MKKIATLFAAIATTLSLYAEGYQVNSLSARQNGMGHTGTALKLGAESMFFNPAGMGFMNKKIDFNGSFTACIASPIATLQGIFGGNASGKRICRVRRKGRKRNVSDTLQKRSG